MKIRPMNKRIMTKRMDLQRATGAGIDRNQLATYAYDVHCTPPFPLDGRQREQANLTTTAAVYYTYCENIAKSPRQGDTAIIDGITYSLRLVADWPASNTTPSNYHMLYLERPA